MSLLELPEELLLLHILPSLDLSAVKSCLATCRKLHTLIASSMLLTYLKELELAGLVNNFEVSFEEVSLEARIRMLREHEERWSKLDWKTQKRLAFNTLPPAVDYVVLQPGGFMACLRHEDFDTFKSLAFAWFPSAEDESIKWDSGWLSLEDKAIVAFYSAIPEYGLVVCVTTSPISSDSSHDDDSEEILQRQSVHILSHATFKPHPLASRPVFDITSIPEEVCVMTDVLVSGETLFVWSVYAESIEDERPTGPTHVGIYNWKTGVQRAKIDIPIESSFRDLVLLRDDLVMFPNTDRASLDIYVVPADGGRDVGEVVDLKKVYTFELPKLDSEFEFISDPKLIVCPVPTGRIVSEIGRAPFAADISQSIILVELEVGRDYDDDTETYYLITHVRHLLNTAMSKCGTVLSSRGSSLDSDMERSHVASSSVVIVPWAEWKERTFTYNMRHTEHLEVFAQRVLIADTETHTARILDFNPHRKHTDLDNIEDEDFKSRLRALSHIPFASDPVAPRASLPFTMSRTVNLTFDENIGFKLLGDRVMLPFGEGEEDGKILGLETFYLV